MKFRLLENFSIKYLINECKNRGIKPEDIFEKPFKLVNAKYFLDYLTMDKEPSYRSDAFDRILLNKAGNSFYDVLMNYLNSATDGKKNYKKLTPATLRHGYPLDGRHRAALCLLLGIYLPVREYMSEELEKVDNKVFDNILPDPYASYMENRVQGDKILTIMLFTPKEYFNACARLKNTTYSAQLREVEENEYKLDNMFKFLEDGNKFSLPILDYTAHYQNGRYKMYVAGDMYGWDTQFPVAVITYLDKEEKKNI